MKHLVLLPIVLFGLTVSCAPIASPQPQVSLTTATAEIPTVTSTLTLTPTSTPTIAASPITKPTETTTRYLTRTPTPTITPTQTQTPIPMVEVGRFSMKGQPGQYKRGALSPDKQYLVTDRVNGSGDPNYVPNIETFISQIWNVSTGTLVGRLEGDEASFSPDGKSVLTCARGIRFWETRTGLLFKVGENPSVSRIGSCRLSPDGRYVVGLTDFSGAKIWEASTGRLTADFAPTGALGGALFSPNGTFLVTITYWPHSPATVDLWRPPTGEQIAHVDKPYRVYVTAAFSPDSSTLLVGDHDSPTISVIEPQTGKVMTELPNLGYDPTFSPDGRFVLVRNDMTVRELDFNSRAVVKEAQFHEIVWNASFSPDGRYVLVLTDPVTVVNADNWLLRVSLDGYSDAFFSPDGKMLVTISGDEVVMWQMK